MPPVSTSKTNCIQVAVVKNWKTTVIGIVLAFSGFVSFSPETFGGRDQFIVKLSYFISSGGLAVLGITAKDFNKSGGTSTDSQDTQAQVSTVQ